MNPRASGRIVSVDVLRGIAMVLMALDHARDYFSGLPFPPEDLSHTWGALFFTRWITHFCAPIFFFLAGTGAWLAASRGKTVSELSRFLWTRGLWLVVLEFTVVGFGWAFRFPFGLAQTIWALGCSMVILSLLVRLRIRWIFAIGLAMIALHNLTDRILPEQFGSFAWLWTMLHVPGFVPVIPNKFVLVIGYPLIPWIGVMAVGYACGAVFKMPPTRRHRILLAAGACASLAFLILRGANLYGNPPYTGQATFLAPADANGPWHPQQTLTLTIISFLDVQKYPPSLQFLLMTLGPSLMLLAWLDRRDMNPITSFFLVYGRVPLMFYVVHIYLIHAMAALFSKHESGLPFIYLMWLTAVLALYLPCRWFAHLKACRRDWWLSYL